MWEKVKKKVLQLMNNSSIKKERIAELKEKNPSC